MTAGRSLWVVLPPETPADVAALLVDAAGALGAAQAVPLTIVDLPGLADAPTTVRALPDGTAWWRCVHPGLEGGDADAALALLPEALRLAGWQPSSPALLLFPAGPAEELGARLAARLGGTALGRVGSVQIDGPAVRARRPAWGGRAALDVSSEDSLCVASWRAQQGGKTSDAVVPSVHEHVLQGTLPEAPQREALAPTDAMPPVEAARIVVSGGRGMEGPEGFRLLSRLADRLGAALGGSLPTVDAGWVPVARQVGQSGKFVSPRLYLAVGISGTPQHLAGISSDTRIIAVNKDPQAPIFAVAQMGVVAAWSELLPLLCDEVEALLAQRAATGA